MKGYIASSISHLEIGGLYYSLNWIIFCYPNLETIKFVTHTAIPNLYSAGETNIQSSSSFLKRINSYFISGYDLSEPVFSIPKKELFLVLEKEQGYYKILFGGKIGYIQALSLFKLRESVERI